MSSENDIESLKNGEHVTFKGHSPILIQSVPEGPFSISPEMFSKMYLSPQNVVKGDLRNTFGNPSPL
jgi:hypothetical protein